MDGRVDGRHGKARGDRDGNRIHGHRLHLNRAADARASQSKSRLPTTPARSPADSPADTPRAARWRTSNAAPRRIQSGAKYPVQVHHLLHRFVLPHDFFANPRFEVVTLSTAAPWVQLTSLRRVHFCLPPVHRRRRIRKWLIGKIADGTTDNHAEPWPKTS